jgi:hypothetical protein
MTEYVRTAAPANDQLDTLVSVLDIVRSGHARTRPELGRRSGLGRTVITQRVQQLIDCGLLEEGALGPSSGGRARANSASARTPATCSSPRSAQQPSRSP